MRCAPTRAAFAPLQPLDPVVIELREGSRMAEDLKQERNRLANRFADHFWRFYPAMLGLTDDVAAPLVPGPLGGVPDPGEGRRGCAKRRSPLLKRHRIRRLSAADVLERLRTPADPPCAPAR